MWCDTILCSPFFDTSSPTTNTIIIIIVTTFHKKGCLLCCDINMMAYFFLYSPMYYFFTLPSQLVACHVNLMIIISKWNQCLTVPIYLVNSFIFFLTFLNSMYVVGRKWQAERKKKKTKQQYVFLLYSCPQLNAHCHHTSHQTRPKPSLAL